MNELGINYDAWNLYKYRILENYTGWPIKNSTNGLSIWETTTFGIDDMIEGIAMKSYNVDFEFNKNVSIKDNIGWLDIKVILVQKNIQCSD